ncbi:Fungal specific transcription factor domain containing protein [Ceratobasidium theobromae]|uniref:Fungal specific transcription factor domain containing protein n=1 Tax=Ceratobasidium theobromae TaxID=1582974 RepID=A0A5N5Q8W5_9AGAM|nr:Fungal specific transcription factor domain containing protein [Ceratobasidium theobromae]
MIGLPSTYRGQQQRSPVDEAIYEAYLQEAAAGLPSSTIPSAAHSHHSTLDSAGYGILEPNSSQPYPTFATLLDRPGPRHQQPHQRPQEVPGDFVPGAGGGTREFYQSRDLSRRDTTHSAYSDRSASSNFSPVRQDGLAPNPGSYPSPSNAYPYYPSADATGSFDNYIGSDGFVSEQYTSPPPMSPEKYIASPEQIQTGYPGQPHQQGIFSFRGGGQNALFGGGGPSPTYVTAGSQNPQFGAGGPSPTGRLPSGVPSPTRPTQHMPTSGRTSLGGGSGSYASNPWQSVDSTSGLAPASSDALGGMRSGVNGDVSGVVSNSSGGSHSSGGGVVRQYTGSSGYSSGNPQMARAIPRPTVTIGRSHSISGGGRASHSHSQSLSGHLAPPTAGGGRPSKRPHHEERDDEDSEAEDEQLMAGRQQRAVKRP